jgi:hypothetical protein
MSGSLFAAASLPVAWLIMRPVLVSFAEENSKEMTIHNVPKEIQARLAAVLGIKGQLVALCVFFPVCLSFRLDTKNLVVSAGVVLIVGAAVGAATW